MVLHSYQSDWDIKWQSWDQDWTRDALIHFCLIRISNWWTHIPRKTSKQYAYCQNSRYITSSGLKGTAHYKEVIWSNDAVIVLEVKLQRLLNFQGVGIYCRKPWKTGTFQTSWHLVLLLQNLLLPDKYLCLVPWNEWDNKKFHLVWLATVCKISKDFYLVFVQKSKLSLIETF